MRNHAPALAAFLFLSACGGSDDTDRASGTTSAADIVAGAAGDVAGNVTGLGVSTADLPDFVELPKGVRPIHNARLAADGRAGGTLTLETSQKPADLVAFYRASMAKHGLKIGLENESAQLVQLMGESEDKSKSLMVMVTHDEEGQVSLHLTHSRTTP